MSKQVLITLLDQGNTGNEILSILDALVADQVSEGTDNVEEETAIWMWCLQVLQWLTLWHLYVMLSDDSGSAVFYGRLFISPRGVVPDAPRIKKRKLP